MADAELTFMVVADVVVLVKLQAARVVAKSFKVASNKITTVAKRSDFVILIRSLSIVTVRCPPTDPGVSN